MKVAILCGGKGMRMHQLTEDIPKPLVSVCGKPLLWHIMKTYKYYGFNEFILLLGYKGKKSRSILLMINGCTTVLHLIHVLER